MDRLGVFIFVAFSMTLASAAVNVSVPLCYQSGVEYTVTGGTVSGVTFVETTVNQSCVFTITNAVTQTFLVNYTTCQATPSITLSGTLHEFIIVVQNNPNFNAGTDSRWLVRCEFNTGTTSVQAMFVGRSNNPSGNPSNNITTTVDPRPLLALYTTENGNETLVNQSTILSLGTNVTARITLDRNTTDYSLQVISGEMSSLLIGQIQILSTVQLLNGTTFCALHEVFFSFQYLQSANSVRYAETQFQAFLPTVSSVNLQTTNLQLRLSFRVTLCLVGSGCAQGTCPDRPSARRRREAVDEATTTTGDQQDNKTYDLEDGFQVILEPNAGGQVDPDGTVSVGGNSDNEETVCLERAEFWGLIMGLIGFLALACLASCCLCFYFLRCRQRKRESRKLSETSTVSTESTVYVNRNLTGEPVNKPSFVLPRFVSILNNGGSK